MKRAIIVLTTSLLVGQICLGQPQESIPNTKGDSDSFTHLKSGVIKSEIAFFNIGVTLEANGDSFPKINVNEIPWSNCTKSSITFSSGDIIVEINSAKFDTTGHKLTYVDSTHPFLTLIDDKPFWGTDGGVPREIIKSVAVTHGKVRMILPDKAIMSLYEPNFCTRHKRTGNVSTVHSRVFQSDDTRRIYIYMINSDGAGGYEVTWIIQDDKYYARVVDYGF